MTDLEDVIIKTLVADGTIKSYSCFVDDTLLKMKPEDVSQVNNALNEFNKSFRYTDDMFQNEVSHFLDLELSPDKMKTFQKDINTGQYVNFTSFVPWTYHTSWMRNFVTSASRMCSTDKRPSEINTIKRFASWNDFSKSVNLSIHYLFLRTLMMQTKQAVKLLSIFVFLAMEIKVFP